MLRVETASPELREAGERSFNVLRQNNSSPPLPKENRPPVTTTPKCAAPSSGKALKEAIEILPHKPVDKHGLYITMAGWQKQRGSLRKVREHDPFAHKAIVYCVTDALVSIGYAGIAFVGSTATGLARMMHWRHTSAREQ